MTFRSMEIFIAVVESGSMRKAAEKLLISQPSVSGVIADLEEEYGVCLFERLNKRLFITADGVKLAGYARRMLSLNDEMSRQMGSVEDDTPLRIGATVTVGTCVIGNIVRNLPGTPPYVLVNNTHIIEQHLLINQLDVALVEGKVKSEDLISKPVIDDELMVICPKAHALASDSVVPFHRLNGEMLIMREQGSATRLTLDKAFSDSELEQNIVWECNNTQAILNAVEQGFGVTILSPCLLPTQTSLMAIPIVGYNMKRKFYIVVHKDKFINKKLQKFIDLCSAWKMV